MNDLEKLLIERTCERLATSYANLLDAYDYEAFLDLWAEDAVLNMLGREFSGRQAIRRWLEGREPGMICRHLVTNIVTDVIDADRARGYCYTISYRVQNALGQEPGPLERPTFLVHYRSEFTRHPARGWLIARRDVVADMAGPAQRQAILGSRKG
ncbi:MAG TPA: nuclear transport factor 2 family protein [Paracoccaceae bacterium]|nr:nuclear transport factor 2 family protein [Paracoccaceae bacterium]